MTYLGYASTTGADFVDYIISDPIVSPPEVAFASSEVRGCGAGAVRVGTGV